MNVINAEYVYLYHRLSEGTTASYNSPSEARMVEIADNFQRQYSHLFPERRPLLMCPENENGIKVTACPLIARRPVNTLC